MTLVMLLTFALPVAAQGRERCAAAADSVTAGWHAYRHDSLAAAAGYFTIAERFCPASLDAANGLAFVSLRRAELGRADSLFRAVIGRDSVNADAWDGLARTAQRRRDMEGMRAAGRRALTLNPGNGDLRAFLDGVDPDWNRAPRAHPAPVRSTVLQLAARTKGDRFEVRTDSGWRPLYLQGVNLGVALPGRFPAEFPPDSATYADWLAMIAGMRANTVRVYTILPPPFYRALRGWNTNHPERTLYLVHGVWTELPPDHDFDQVGWKAEFRAEMRRVVDVIHGAADVPPRPGHAGGQYDADVSRWILAYVIGREWEPYAVQAYGAAHRGIRSYRGRYLAMARGAAMERWMAEQCDFLLAYEKDRYNALRPIAYTNWPTLDPLHHPTESTAADERRFRGDSGDTATGGVDHEEDAAALDPMTVRPTAANPAGWFASYHVYPYYPDFINYDPGYSEARSSEGPSNYFGYLVDLKRHHAGVPLLIAEFGVPSSRGAAHLQPQGWHHGGHDEQAMAAIDARLAREVRESGAAGGILFAWMDEWFKRNWAVANFEIPADHRPRWHNAMDAEQHYGILGQYAGDGTEPVLGGDPRRWVADDTTASGKIGLHLRQDASYLYVGVSLPAPRGRAFPWDSLDVLIAFDTYDAGLGQTRLPDGIARSEIGFEFLAEFRGPGDAELRITPDYNPYAPAATMINGDDFGRFYRGPAASVARDDGQFDSLLVIINRARYGRDGRFFPAQGYNRGRLRFGTTDQSTLADWYYDSTASLLELRLPWGLLNVTDPSTRTVLAQRPGAPFATVQTDGFRIGVVVRGDSGGANGRHVVAALPPLSRDGRWAARTFSTWSWSTWVEPTFHSRLKPVYDSVRAVWERSR
jgi:hypothetical protein